MRQYAYSDTPFLHTQGLDSYKFNTSVFKSSSRTYVRL
jgi:hypothetical protein